MAFDLVAKLKLQDEFSDKLKSVFAQLDKLKGQVKQAATGTSDMGAKFSTAGTVASKALEKVENTAKTMSTNFDKYSALSKSSIQSIGSGAEEMKNVLNMNSVKGSSSLESLGKTADRLPVKFSEFSNVAGRTLADASNAAGNLGKSISESGQRSERSLSSLSNSAGMIQGSFEKSGKIAGRSIESVSKSATVLGTSTDKAAKLSQTSLNMLGSRADQAAKRMISFGSGASSSVSKVANDALKLNKELSSVGNAGVKSLNSIANHASKVPVSIGAVGKSARLSESSISMLGSRADQATKKMSGIGVVGAKSLNKVVSVASKAPGPVGLVAKAAKVSQGALKSLGGVSAKTFKLMSTDSTASLKMMSSGAEKMTKVFSLSGIKSSNAFIKISDKANGTKDALRKVGDGGKKALDAVDRSLFRIPSKMGGFVSKMRSGFANGINKPASTAKNAIMGIASAVGVVAIASKGFNLLKGAIEGAVARYDTLNAFPKVMEKIGFSTDESTKSIQRLAEGIDGLPTTLGEVADTAQRIAVMTKDLDGATETTLALNNAFLASGADAEKAARGTEQYIKMIATGTVGMDSWTTLQETMGLALNDLAEAFGYTGKSAQNDLYKALKDGDVTFDQFNKKLVELSKKTGGFAETALDGSGGIATAWKNIRTAVTNGVAGSITAIDKALGGTGEIEEIIKKIKPVISDTFKDANAKLESFAKQMKKIYDATKPVHPLLKDIAKAALIFGGVLGGMAVAAGTIAGMGALFALIGSGVGIAILAVAGLVTGFVLAYQKIEPFRNAVQDLLGTFKEVFNVLKSGSGGGDLMAKMGFNEEQIQVARNFVDSVAESFGKVKESFRQLGDFLLQKKDELAPTMDLLAEAFSIGKDVLVSVFTTLWAVLEPIFSALKNAIMIVADIAVMAFTNIVVPALKFAMQNFQLLWTIVGPILKLLGSAIGLSFGVLKIVWDTILKPVVKFLSGIFAKTLENVGKKIDSVKGNFEMFGGAIEKVAGWFDSFKSALSRFKVPKWLSKLGGGGTVKFEGGGGDDGGGEGRYNGIKYVPKDGYQIRAHRGERVLTAKENKEYNKGGGGRAIAINMYGTVIREEADVDRLAEKMVRKFIAAGEGGA